jgi:hypothetical protein
VHVEEQLALARLGPHAAGGARDVAAGRVDDVPVVVVVVGERVLAVPVELRLRRRRGAADVAARGGRRLDHHGCRGHRHAAPRLVGRRRGHVRRGFGRRRGLLAGRGQRLAVARLGGGDGELARRVRVVRDEQLERVLGQADRAAVGDLLGPLDRGLDAAVGGDLAHLPCELGGADALLEVEVREALGVLGGGPREELVDACLGT